MDTSSFLRAILPKQGVYFSATPREEGGFAHWAFDDVEDLAEHVVKLSGKGQNAYFACANFAESKYYDEAKDKWKRRTQENAISARAQWIDIDCGNKEYPTKQDGIKAMLAFCKASGIARPNLVVDSGNGIHAYWLFDQAVEREVWNKSAKLFKRVCAHFKFAQTDTSRTADIASVLRPIGTNNDKSAKGKGVNPVKLVGIPNLERIPFSDWIRQLVKLKADLGIREPVEKVRDDSRNADLTGGTEYPPSDANKVAERCQQVRFMRDYRGAGQTEPHWYQTIGVVLFCENGEDTVHEWSSGHDGYDEDATQAKIEQRREQAGPTSCEWYKEHHADGCKGCKYAERNLPSPIMLGYPEPEHETETVVEVEEEGEVVEKTETFPEFPPRVAERFRWKKNELYIRKDDEWVPFCAQLPIPQYIFYDTDSDGFMLRISVRVRPFVWRDADISMKVIGQGGSQLMSELGAKAGIIARGAGGSLVDYMRTWAEAIQSEYEEVSMHTHLGWYEDGSFLLGNQKYMPSGEIKEVRVSEAMAREMEAHTPTGDLDRYVELINTAYNRPGHEMYQFTWLAAFASPMLRLVSTGPVGIPLIAWSKESGQGKTTTALAGVSVWGNPWAPNQVANANKVTEYALYVMAGVRRDIPVVLDEATMWEAKRLAQFAYDYSDGRPKVQGKASGGLRDNSDIEWSNFIYVNANNSVVDLMSHSIVNSAPQIARVWEYQFDIDHDRTMTREQGNRVFDELWGHYAVAGDAFLRYLVPNAGAIKKLIFGVRDKFAEMTNVRKDARNWLLAAATVWVAYQITRKLGLQQFDGDSLKQWIVNRLGSMQNMAVESVRDMQDVIGSMISDLQSGFIVTMNEGDRRSGQVAQYAAGFGPPKTAITGRMIIDLKRLYISQSAVKQWCVDNKVAYREILEAVKNKGWVVKSDKFYLGKGTSIALPQTSVLALDLVSMSSMLKLVGGEKEETDARVAGV